ncbi:signal transduction histidine kinase [Stanieria sp. NIES-3757]|nr:signal transduction histidine kinase [Stanieria sp. NIES-3757]
MSMTQYQKAIGVFRHRAEAEAALRELQHSGYPMDRVSVIAQNAEQTQGLPGADVREDVGNKADEGATTGAVTGGALGGLTGLLVGLGTLAIPGVGPILLAGTAATALATTLAGGAIGAAAGGLVGGLIGLGIPEERARVYNDRVKQGYYLVIIEGTPVEVERAEAILRRHGIQDWDVYGQPERQVAPTNVAPTNIAPPHVTRTNVAPTTNVATPITSNQPVNRLGRRLRAVGLFAHHRDAEAALRDLDNAHFSKNQISLVGRQGSVGDRTEGDLTDRTKTDEGAKAGAATGGLLGGLGGLLVGLGALAIPGIGPVIAGGALATALTTAVAGGAIGAAAGGLTGALVGLGIPDERANFYNERVSRGDYLVMVDGTEEEIRQAEAILRHRGIQDWDVFEQPQRQVGSTNVAHTDVTPATNVTRTNVTPPPHVTHTNVAPTTNVATPITSNQPVNRLGRRLRAVGLFAHRRDAEAALRDLDNAHFSKNQISLVGRQGSVGDRTEGDLTDRTKTDEGAKAGAATGGLLGGLGGLLVGLGALAIPGIGPVIAGGALATALTTAVAGGAIGAAAGGLTGALVGLGIPDERANFYNERVSRGDYLVMVDGTEEEIRQAEAILRHRGIQDWDVFDADRDRPSQSISSNRESINSRPVTELNPDVPTTRVNSTDYVTTTTRPTTNRTINARKHAIAVFPHRQEAELAVRDLREAGFPLEQVSVVATETSTDRPFSGIRTHNRIDNYESLGILEPAANTYRDRLNRGQYLVMLDGTDEELQRAEARLNHRAIQQWDIYQVFADHPEVIVIDHRHPEV